jgi:two-component system, chemotaxis family, chemotaxis protein CheY
MSYHFENISVLIVEDNQPMLELAKSIMMTFGVENIETARNGEDGFKLFCKQKPDIVIADWMMKPMDGISLTRRIRNDPASVNPFTPVILMTGFSEKRRVMQALTAAARRLPDMRVNSNVKPMYAPKITWPNSAQFPTNLQRLTDEL